MAEVRKRIIFHGRVQGVGFRFTAKHLANSLGLTGWVQNEYDGTVPVSYTHLDVYKRQVLRDR